MPVKYVDGKLVLSDMSTETITENTIAVCSQHKNPRLHFLMERLVTHLHDFARETRLTIQEWETAIAFLTKVGQISDDVRHEFVLLSDILGLSVLVDGISNPKPKEATDGTLLGPFHTHFGDELEQGTNISLHGRGEPLLFEGTIRDLSGNPVVGATIDIWECDENGLYDLQYKELGQMDLRGVFRLDENGEFVIKGTRPVPYPIPNDGPVGQFLRALGRHPYRPAHIHFIIEKDGFCKLTTALYAKDDPYEYSDAVFGVKTSLLFELVPLGKEKAKKYNLKENDWYLKWDFVIVTNEEQRKTTLEAARKCLETDGKGHYVLNNDGLPISPLD